MVEMIKRFLGIKKEFKLTQEEIKAINKFINNPLALGNIYAYGFNGEDSMFYLGPETEHGFPICRILHKKEDYAN